MGPSTGRRSSGAHQRFTGTEYRAIQRRLHRTRAAEDDLNVSYTHESGGEVLVYVYMFVYVQYRIYHTSYYELYTYDAHLATHDFDIYYVYSATLPESPL